MVLKCAYSHTQDIGCAQYTYAHAHISICKCSVQLGIHVYVLGSQKNVKLAKVRVLDCALVWEFGLLLVALHYECHQSAVYVEMDSTKEFLSTLNENVKHTQVMSHDWAPPHRLSRVKVPIPPAIDVNIIKVIYIRWRSCVMMWNANNTIIISQAHMFTACDTTYTVM